MMSAPITHEIRRFEILDSTNDYCFRNASTLLSGSVVITGFQSEGKGTMGRKWHSNANDNLLFSLLYKDEPFTSHPLFSLKIALALAKVLQESTLLPLIKWPNDLIVSDKKIAGILIEVKQNVCVVGIGFNINQSIFPYALNLPATSLFNQTGKSSEPLVVLLKVLDAIDETLGFDDASVLMNYRELLYQRNQICKVNLNGNRFEARITDVDRDGCLIVTDYQEQTFKIPSKAMLEE